MKRLSRASHHAWSSSRDGGSGRVDRDDEGDELLAEIGVREADAGHVGHARVGDEHLLHLGRVHVHPAGHDHVGEAIGDEHPAVGVDHADLAQREDARFEVGGGGALGVALVDDAAAGGVAEVQASLLARWAARSPCSSTTSAVYGATERPTEPGWTSQSSLVIEVVTPTSVAP